MDYAELKTNIQDICENSFTDEQLAMFTQQAEQKIYNSVQIPALRKNVTANLTAGNKYLALPSDYLYTYSLAVQDADGDYVFLLDKDVNFIREAYPSASATGFPESIVTAGTTWLGDEFDSALLNGALVEAIRFMKGEQDMVNMYNQMYVLSIGLLKNLGDGKLRGDTYRSGQPKNPVS